ncbi:Membrane-bound metal-dependent hydrolase [Photobacterium marinum]|uniref:Membrane-bound metal-dependent hydrolase n=1 Tax=Photobacterium marinum TaxID=1056511 RepID=L8J7Y7_9GAMM|nr:metal-dependent hydrolase [Photobacterium marinum]ELR64995.1 Membrane-bound metal-dependent hydrolase [Photobacterium marinum]
MDSVTQAALGAAVAGVVAGRKCSPKILLAGAALGTLPDLDVLISYGDPVSDMVKHRGFSHSMLVLLPFSLLLAGFWHKWWPTRFSFRHLWLLIAACLITHPLLDAFTSYGTQLLWPFSVSVAVSSIFIIDPLYTLPLLLMLVAGLIWHQQMARLCRIGLVISSCYLIWSVVALNIIEDRVREQLDGTPLAGSPVFITPTPINTVLWRVVVLDGETYWEGLTSLLDEQPDVDFLAKERGSWLLAEKSVYLNMLESFTHHFVKYEQVGASIKVTDLRLGLAEYLPFQFVLASQNSEGSWAVTDPQRLEGPRVSPKHLPALWLRLLGNQDIDANLCHIKECPKPIHIGV